MKVLVFSLVLFICYTLATTTRRHVIEEEHAHRISYFLVETPDGPYQLEDLTDTSPEVRVSTSDVIYYFCSQSNTNCTAVTNGTIDIPEETFDPIKDILVCIHGWHNNHTSPVNTLIKAAILDKFDLNFIIVDWSSIAKQNYIVARNAVSEVGLLVSEFLQNLTSTYNIPVTQIGIVGHSLGAHVSGVSGSNLGGQVNHIVGLDPAGPLISVTDTDNCLDSSDAQFVQVIHTNGVLLGLFSALGHTDYYPNGGGRQPGCGLDLTGSCAHGRSYEYYAESIRNQFVSQDCSSYLKYTFGECNGNYSIMGGYNLDMDASGDYYLTTNEQYPYSIS